jgi:hypothetical protein
MEDIIKPITTSGQVCGVGRCSCCVRGAKAVWCVRACVCGAPTHIPPKPPLPPQHQPPRSQKVADLKTGIARFYDESSGLWEEVWGEHMHHGYYPAGGPPKTNQQAQIDMIDESLKWAGVEAGPNAPKTVRVAAGARQGGGGGRGRGGGRPKSPSLSSSMTNIKNCTSNPKHP